MIGGSEGILWCLWTHRGVMMTFKEVLAQVIAWLQQDQQISYGALKRQFALDDAALADASRCRPSDGAHQR
jgi:hypothetical protein